MNIIEWLRVIFLGIVEGITEWLPVSSTGHLILVDAFWKTSAPEVFTPEFTEMFDVVIQLGAILAVVTVFFYKLNPFSARKTSEQKHNTIELWKKVIIGCIPAGVIGVLFNDLIDQYLMNWLVVAIMLIVVGIAFIVVEMRNRKVRPSIVKFTQLSYKTAFIIGVFQLLSLIRNFPFWYHHHRWYAVWMFPFHRSRVYFLSGNSDYVWCQWLKDCKVPCKGWWLHTRAVLCHLTGNGCRLWCIHDRNQVLNAVHQAS